MRFVVDIQHPVDVNFFRGTIHRLLSDGHEVLLVVLRRGRVPAIVRHDYPALESIEVGLHVASRLGLYLRTGLWRELELVRALRGRKLDGALGFPGFQTAIVARLLGFPSVGAYDDPEHRPNFVLARLWLDRFVLPDYLGYSGHNIVPFRGLKEWAYLCPEQFTPSSDALKPYGLQAKQYIFVREVEPRSLNYLNQKDEIVRAVYDAGLSEHRVVLSLEDKRRRGLFKNWLILEEPVADIHSLIYYSRALVSSGDSMAREAAQLGVLSLYCGQREMIANDVMYEHGLMRHSNDASAIAQELVTAVGSADQQQQTRQRLHDLWDDPTDVLVNALYDAVRNRR